MPERRQMVTIFVCGQEEETTQAAAASQAKQGQWMNLHDVEMRKISCRESGCKKQLDSTPGDIIRFLNHSCVCLRINGLQLTLCWLKTGTVEFILCKWGRKVHTRHVQRVPANGAKCGTGDC